MESRSSDSECSGNETSEVPPVDDQQLPQFDDTPSTPFKTGVTWSLTVSEVDSFINSANIKDLNPNPPVNPKGGDVYLFAYRNCNPPDHRFRCDQLFWHNDARRRFPGSKGKYYKTYFIPKSTTDDQRKNKDPDCFKRAEYRLVSPKSAECVGVMHYLGDEKKCSQRAHGNSQSDRPYIRNKPIVAQQIRKEIHPLVGPKKTYENLKNQKTAAAGTESVALPRDRKQVSNIMESERHKLRPTQDALYNLLMFMRKGPLEFVNDIDCKKNDLTVSCMLPGTMEIVEDCITEYPNEPLVILYDTTFNLGEFYASAAIFRHSCLTDDPVFPLAVLLHERKLAENHNRFIEDVFQQLPLHSDTQVVIITDREFDFSRLVPNSTHVYCWNHLTDNVKRKLAKNKLELQNSIINDVGTILRCHSLEEANAKCNEVSENWPTEFKDYFFESIMPAIRRSGRWILQPLKLYSRISGITTNASESFNKVIKSWTNWKEMPIDLAVLAFYNLFQYYYVEYDRAKFGLGDFKLKPGIRLRPASEMPARSTIMKPDAILEQIREGKISKEQLPPSNETIPMPAGASATVRRAQHLLDQGAVDHITKRKVFIVKEDNATFMVSFEPNKCTCGARACHHLIAARLSCNLSATVKTSRNLTTLRRQDKRKISRKRPGRKQPRKDDYRDVTQVHNETLFEEQEDIEAEEQDTLLNSQLDPTATSRSPSPTQVSTSLPASQLPNEALENTIYSSLPPTEVLNEFSEVQQSTTSPLTESVTRISETRVSTTLHPTDFTQEKNEEIIGHTATSKIAADVQNLPLPTSQVVPEDVVVQNENYQQNDEFDDFDMEEAAQLQLDSIIKALAAKAMRNDEEEEFAIDLSVPKKDSLALDVPAQEDLIREEELDLDEEDELPPQDNSGDNTATSCCFCDVPSNNDDMIMCDAKSSEHCRVWYHRRCDNVGEEYFATQNKRKSIRSKLYWECSICFQQTHFRWGPSVKIGRQSFTLINSCTIDPCLTTFYVQAKFNKNFLEQLPQSCMMLWESMTKALGNNFPEALLQWVEYLRTSKVLPDSAVVDRGQVRSINLFGDMESLFLSHLDQLTKMQRSSTCSSSICPNKSMVLTSNDLTKQPNETMQQMINRELRFRRQRCNQRTNAKGEKCSGQRSLHVPSMALQLPLMLPPIFLCNAQFSSIFELPLEISLQRKSYRLGSVLLHSTDHFACVLVRLRTATPEYYLCDDLEPVMLKVDSTTQVEKTFNLQYALYFYL